MSRQPCPGFSLPELLITLAILGVLATFSIPAVFTTSTSGVSAKHTALARDSAHMVMSAYEQYKAVNPSVSSNTTFGNLTPYMNYVAVDSSTTIDSVNGSTTAACGTFSCLRLHSGAMLLYNGGGFFSGTNTTNVLFFWIDPDGRQTDNTTNGPGKSICIWLQYDGKLYSWGTLPNTVTISYGGLPINYSATPANDPVWFTGF